MLLPSVQIDKAVIEKKQYQNDDGDKNVPFTATLQNILLVKCRTKIQ